MKIAIAAFTLCLSACSTMSTREPGGAGVESPSFDNRLTAYLGQRNLDEGDYAPVDEQIMLGLEYSQERAGSPVGFEIGVAGSGDSENGLGPDVTASTGEFYGGLRKSFGEGGVRPYVGGGLAFISSRFEAFGLEDDDTSPAAYVHGGVEFHLTERLILGFDLRSLFGSDMTLFGVETDADYTQFALFFAARF